MRRASTSPRSRQRLASRTASASTLAILVALTIGGGTAIANPYVKIVAPRTAYAPQKVRFTAKVLHATRRVAFYIDGHRRWVDRVGDGRFHHTGYLHTAHMAAGSHRLKIRARLSNGRIASANRMLYIAKASAKLKSGGHKSTETTGTSTPSGTPTSPSELLFKGTHISDFAEIQAAPGAITEVADPLGSGEGVLNFTVNDKDVYPVTPTENPRAQALSPALINSGDEVWVKTKFMLPSNFPSSVPGWMSLISIYGPPFNGSSPWRIGITGSEISWQRNGTYGYDVPWNMPLTRGKWITVLLHERLASNGWVEMWIDGEQVTFFSSGTYNPANVPQTDRLEMATMDSSNDGGANSAKIMQYRKVGMFETATVYFGALEIGKSRTSVES